MQTMQTHLRYEKITYYLEKTGINVDDYFQESYENLQGNYCEEMGLQEREISYQTTNMNNNIKGPKSN